MGIKWRTQKEVRLLNTIWEQREDLAVDHMAVNEGDVQGFAGGFYYLVDIQPLGGWKGNSWAIIHSDLSDINAWYFGSKTEAEKEWTPAREAVSRLDE